MFLTGNSGTEVPEMESSFGVVQSSWDSISLGRSHILTPQLQKELMEKLNFCTSG
jgi:hypothetical protein